MQTNNQTDSVGYTHMHVHMHTDTCYNDEEKDAIIWKWVGDMGGVKGQVAGRDWKAARNRRKWLCLFKIKNIVKIIRQFIYLNYIYAQLMCFIFVYTNQAN